MCISASRSSAPQLWLQRSLNLVGSTGCRFRRKDGLLRLSHVRTPQNPQDYAADDTSAMVNIPKYVEMLPLHSILRC